MWGNIPTRKRKSITLFTSYRRIFSLLRLVVSLLLILSLMFH